MGMIVGFLGGAGPAAADTLVSNITQTSVGFGEELDEVAIVTPFTTGANVTGYNLESITLDFLAGSQDRDPVYVYLHEDNGSGRPNHVQGGQVATLSKNGINYASPVAGRNTYRVWKARCYPQPPHGGGCLQDASSVYLAPNATYWVYVWAGNRDNTAELDISSIPTLSANQAGWSIGETLSRNHGAAYSTYARTNTYPLLKIEGTTNPAVTVSIADVTVTEGTHARADFVVSLNRATSGPVTFDWETVAGTASDAGDGDFYNDDDTLTIQPGETQTTISVAINDDAVAESDETFEVRLSNLRGANSFADDRGTATIVTRYPWRSQSTTPAQSKASTRRSTSPSC